MYDPVPLNLSTMVYYFSLTTNQRTVLFNLAFQHLLPDSDPEPEEDAHPDEAER